MNEGYTVMNDKIIIFATHSHSVFLEEIEGGCLTWNGLALSQRGSRRKVICQRRSWAEGVRELTLGNLQHQTQDMTQGTRGVGGLGREGRNLHRPSGKSLRSSSLDPLPELSISF